MKNLVFVFVVLLVGIAVMGFCRGRFQKSTDSPAQKPSATLAVDRGTIQEDEQKAKHKVLGFGLETNEKSGDSAETDKEPERQP
jgi:hypothetical protein